MRKVDVRVEMQVGKDSMLSFSPETVLELKPGAGNPRNSEGAFITLRDGRIRFIYSRYNGDDSGDHGAALLASATSGDGGRSWLLDPDPVVAREGQMNVMSVSLLRLQDGRIALFYLCKNSLEDCLPRVRFSEDEGETWSDPITCITDPVSYYVVNNDRVIQLEGGRLLMPAARHDSIGGQFNAEATLLIYASDDSGLTWALAGAVPNPGHVLVQEPGLVELSDGRILLFARTDRGCQYFSYSSDGGAGWSAIAPGNLPSPLGSASIKRVPGRKMLLAAWNCNGGEDPAIAGRRTPMTTAFSLDDGQSWEGHTTLDADPDGWFSYIAIHFVDPETVLLAHTAGNQTQGQAGLNTTRLVRMQLSPEIAETARGGNRASETG